ncbi:class I SAM-dependent methyltransferase [Nonomuraea spiralis]|uniref:Class I SAM-dependent methyltransferase n=1 Tax=Nonomuraea spiralis TaxID=46182 RepID=A0ABV5IIC6_9ACTN|nr:class I SAM-dependent methyltransferase [Nonomuraea spiralis]GGS96941.1 methyltransferase [Nonomuraea spiralis]
MSDPIAHTTATYDRIASDYDERFTDPPPAFAAFRERFASALPAGARIADLGCGPGRETAWFKERGLAPVGVDRSIGMAKLAAGRGVPAVLGDLRYPPLPPASVDGIWSAAALLHVPSEQTEPTLRAWHAALRPGGVLGLITALGESEGWEPVPYRTEYERWFVHRDPGTLLAALDACGFEVSWHESNATHRTWFNVLATARG